MMSKIGIQAKMLSLIMAATIIPLLLLNMFWTYSERQALIQATKSQQVVLTEYAAEKVNAFIDQKIRSLILHSQDVDVQAAHAELAVNELKAIFLQDKNIKRVALVDQGGQEVLVLDDKGNQGQLQNVKQSDAFRVVSFLAGKEYISPVTPGTDGQPTVVVAVPIVSFTTPQQYDTLSTAESGVIRGQDDIRGALIAHIDLSDLWQSVLSTTSTLSGSSGKGYAYLVDDKGRVIAHPDTALVNRGDNLSSIAVVSLFKANLNTTHVDAARSVEAKSEKGQQVLATYQKTHKTNWGVIFQEPLGSIYKDINLITELGILLSAGTVLVMAILSATLSHKLTEPIIRITDTAKRIGTGDFNARIYLRRNDEIGSLAKTINAMGRSLHILLGQLQAERNQLETIINSTCEGMMAIDKRGVILLGNQPLADLLGIKLDVILGKRITKLLTWQKNSKPIVLDYTRSGTHRYTNLTFVTPAGTLNLVHVTVAEIQNKDGVAQAIVTISQATD